jgi:hypothetical protein
LPFDSKVPEDSHTLWFAIIIAIVIAAVGREKSRRRKWCQREVLQSRRKRKKKWGLSMQLPRKTIKCLRRW